LSAGTDFSGGRSCNGTPARLVGLYARARRLCAAVVEADGLIISPTIAYHSHNSSLINLYASVCERSHNLHTAPAVDNDVEM